MTAYNKRHASKVEVIKGYGQQSGTRMDCFCQDAVSGLAKTTL